MERPSNLRFIPIFLISLGLLSSCAQMSPSSAGSSSGLGAGGGTPAVAGSSSSGSASSTSSSASSTSGGDGGDSVPSVIGVMNPMDSGMKQKSDGQDIHNKGPCVYARVLYDSKPELPASLFVPADGPLAIRLSLEGQTVVPSAEQDCPKDISELDPNGWKPAGAGWAIQVVYFPSGDVTNYQQCLVDADSVSLTVGAGQINFYATSDLVSVGPGGQVVVDLSDGCNSKGLGPFPPYSHYDPSATGNNYLGSIKLLTPVAPQSRSQTSGGSSPPSYNPNY